MSGPFRLIYADPPWRFKTRSAKGLGKSAERHYPTMDLADMKAMPIAHWAAKDALLVMWIYDPMMSQAIELAESWGFKGPVTPLFRWLKTTKNGKLCFGQGYHTRGGGCEEAWLFKRGRGLPRLAKGIRKEFFAPRREHSRKPDEVRDWIVQLYGDVTRVELFARTPAPGWAAWGNETTKFQVAAE